MKKTGREEKGGEGATLGKRISDRANIQLGQWRKRLDQQEHTLVALEAQNATDQETRLKQAKEPLRQQVALRGYLANVTGVNLDEVVEFAKSRPYQTLVSKATSDQSCDSFTDEADEFKSILSSNKGFKQQSQSSWYWGNGDEVKAVKNSGKAFGAYWSGGISVEKTVVAGKATRRQSFGRDEGEQLHHSSEVSRMKRAHHKAEEARVIVNSAENRGMELLALLAEGKPAPQEVHERAMAAVHSASTAITRCSDHLLELELMLGAAEEVSREYSAELVEQMSRWLEVGQSLLAKVRPSASQSSSPTAQVIFS
ncbi:unnamed protein product [Chrysoparadoxa australica]